jgi:hypothetical protein
MFNEMKKYKDAPLVSGGRVVLKHECTEEIFPCMSGLCVRAGRQQLYLKAALLLQRSASYREELQKYDSLCILQIDVKVTMAST